MSYFLTKNLWETYYRLKCTLYHNPLDDIESIIPGTAIVTGATSGIGYEIAKGLAEKGYRVFLPCRNITQGRQIANTIGLDPDDVYYMDLAVPFTIMNFAKTILNMNIKINILVNNAGTLTGYSSKIYQVNYEGPVMLTEELKDIITDRIIHVSSVAHSLANPKDDMFADDDRMTVYANTKLYNILYSDMLNKRFHYKNLDSPVSVAVNPGYVATNLYRPTDLSGILWHISNGTFMAKSPEEGAGVVLYACFSEHPFKGYLSDYHIENVCYPANTKNITEKLWRETEWRYNEKKSERYGIYNVRDNNALD
jgi:NAD(P)-dependent dehydrogenase (short-subunit alcohol dehydrogenase family)